MQKCVGGVCVSLILCAVLSETLGMVIAAKEKRGWTLNSAGYLLGPRRIDHLIQIKDAPSARGREELLGEYAIDSHRTLSDKHGLAGKRDMEDDFKSGPLRITDEDVVHTVIDFLSYLKLKGPPQSRWTVRDDSSSAAAQCSAGHPLVHQWTQDAAPQDAAPQDATPQDTASQDAAPQDAAPQDAAHRTLAG
ncbi:hypothetical protein NFI96_010475 [Prochilodus magdalenae]|nr:hypothetical protein NFI96_010475 [Prochilodus magdalenae]